jgi:hypothetical protein
MHDTLDETGTEPFTGWRKALEDGARARKHCIYLQLRKLSEELVLQTTREKIVAQVELLQYLYLPPILLRRNNFLVSHQEIRNTLKHAVAEIQRTAAMSTANHVGQSLLGTFIGPLVRPLCKLLSRRRHTRLVLLSFLRRTKIKLEANAEKQELVKNPCLAGE